MQLFSINQRGLIFVVAVSGWRGGGDRRTCCLLILMVPVGKEDQETV